MYCFIAKTLTPDTKIYFCMHEHLKNREKKNELLFVSIMYTEEYTICDSEGAHINQVNMKIEKCR